jgi:hypothetical protein
MPSRFPRNPAIKASMASTHRAAGVFNAAEK